MQERGKKFEPDKIIFNFYDQDKVIQRELLPEVENLDVNLISGRSLFN